MLHRIAGTQAQIGRPPTRPARARRYWRRARLRVALLLLLAGWAVLALGPVADAARWRAAAAPRVEQTAPATPPAERNPSPGPPADEVVDLGATVWAPGEAAR
jgi:hypothetical protein